MSDDDLIIKLNDKLKNDNIFISLEELKEVIDIYDKRVTFMKEILGLKSSNNFNFIHCNKSKYYEIFKRIIICKEKNLLGYLDNTILLGEFGYRMDCYTMHNFLALIENEIKRCACYGRDRIIFRSFEDTISLFGIVLDDIGLDGLSNSRVISERYLKTIKLFDKLRVKYFNDIEGIYNCEHYAFDYMISTIYLYYVDNDILRKEPERAFKFLNYINRNTFAFVDKIDFSGVQGEIDYYKYIDTLYHDFDNKVKMIK